MRILTYLWQFVGGSIFFWFAVLDEAGKINNWVLSLLFHLFYCCGIGIAVSLGVVLVLRRKFHRK
jgi:hypothetical protein